MKVPGGFRFVVLGLAALLVAGCVPNPVVDGLALTDTVWRAVTLTGNAPVAGREPTLFFHTIELREGRLVISGPEGELVFVGVPVGTGSRGSNTTLG